MTDDVSIFQEIDDSLRVDNLERLLRRYGKLLIATCIGIVFATAGFALWKNHVNENNSVKTGILIDAQELLESGKTAEGMKKLEELENADGSIATISKMIHAQTLMNAGQADKAEETYSEIARNKGSDIALRDLSSIDASIINSNNNSPNAKNDADTLKALYGNNSPFSPVAGELYALDAQKNGKSKEAQNALSDIANNPLLLTSERVQAKELLDAMKEK